MFFEINPDLKSDYFDLARARKECVPHPDGRPKASLYISIYRAMEHVGLPDYGTLYLVTRDGRVLGIAAAGDIRGEGGVGAAPVPGTVPRLAR